MLLLEMFGRSADIAMEPDSTLIEARKSEEDRASTEVESVGTLEVRDPRSAIVAEDVSVLAREIVGRKDKVLVDEASCAAMPAPPEGKKVEMEDSSEAKLLKDDDAVSLEKNEEEDAI